ncbi:MAG: nucleoside deaminase [Spirochaetes bacterium]|nr:nucleoside deaminase [Spirochaetota bacterium]
MRIALEEAWLAYGKGEIPVGAVLVKDMEIIARAHNSNRELCNPVKHAEIICIEEASRVLNSERLSGCDLYVTKEPCAMCAGAIVHARIKGVFIGAEDEKYGACGTVLSVCGSSRLNHMPVIEFGILREESSDILKNFFKELREGT